jgi:hypothetical protein
MSKIKLAAQNKPFGPNQNFGFGRSTEVLNGSIQTDG